MPVRRERRQRSIRRALDPAQTGAARIGAIWDKFPDVRNPPAITSRADAALAAALRVAVPLVTLLLREGVTYGRFANALKTTFLEAAPDVLAASGARMTDSSIATLTGVHRKDVREWRSVGQPLAQGRTLSVAMAVFTRWMTDPAYCDRRGRPRVLDRVGTVGSFEALASEISSDVHAHTLLQELVRLGVVRRVEPRAKGGSERVELCMAAFVPSKDAADMLHLLSDNVGDHLAAAVHNVLASGTPMLEQSVFADNLTPASVDAIGALARGIWSKALRELVHQAGGLSASDAPQPGADQRVRVGMYFYRASGGTPDARGSQPD